MGPVFVKMKEKMCGSTCAGKTKSPKMYGVFGENIETPY